MKLIKSRGCPGITPSCPSRGTWIEIQKAIYKLWKMVSCPSRGTWIEISPAFSEAGTQLVVPLAGHVD